MTVGQREEANVRKHRLRVRGARRGVAYAAKDDEISLPVIGAVKVARGWGQIFSAGWNDLLPSGRLEVKSIDIGGVVFAGSVRFAAEKVDPVAYNSSGGAYGWFRDISYRISRVCCEVAN